MWFMVGVPKYVKVKEIQFHSNAFWGILQESFEVISPGSEKMTDKSWKLKRFQQRGETPKSG